MAKKNYCVQINAFSILFNEDGQLVTLGGEQLSVSCEIGTHQLGDFYKNMVGPNLDWCLPSIGWAAELLVPVRSITNETIL